MATTIDVTAQSSSALTRVSAPSYERAASGVASSNLNSIERSGPSESSAYVATAHGVTVARNDSVDVAANYVARQTQKDQSNSAATTVRQLESARSNIDKMRANLTQIVKMYPPYPHDSSERARLLTEASGLRQVTEQLTIPPPYDAAVKQGLGASSLGHINSSDAEVAQSLDSLTALSSSISGEVKRLYSGANVGPSGGTGGELLAAQQSVSVGAELSDASAGVSSKAGRSLVASLGG